MTSDADGGSTTVRAAPNATKKLKPASPDAMSDAELLEQLMLATHNVVPSEGIEDVGPVRVMFENGIETR